MVAHEGGGWVGGWRHTGGEEFCFGIDPPRPDEDITRSSQYSAQCLLLPSPAPAAPLGAVAAATPPTAASSTSSPNAAAPTRAPLTVVDALGRETETETSVVEAEIQVFTSTNY